ncbi:MAG: quinone-dependent dihydroorotate dehydrogenase [Ginsengibacter sp.]
MYKLLRNILFWFDAEGVHHFSMNFLRVLCNNSFIRHSIRKKFNRSSESISRSLFGLNFSNPVGLAAGFDKNAKYLRELSALGFGFVEIGTVTPLPQSGNSKPRLFRLPKDKALVNRMGFNNEGVAVIAERLKKYRLQESVLKIGGNIGKNKNTPNEDARLDYEKCFNSLHGCVDYFVVNVSSPNTPGLRDLQQKVSLRTILTHLQKLNRSKPEQTPLLLKISPDLSLDELNDVIDLAFEIELDGIVVANTTIKREHLISSALEIKKVGAGGLSGMPLRETSTQMIKYICERTVGKIPVIASGGIFTGKDAKEKMEAGASLIQVWTGFIYVGPSIVKNICKSIN